VCEYVCARVCVRVRVFARVCVRVCVYVHACVPQVGADGECAERPLPEAVCMSKCRFAQ
jgi:hypothetical protein